MAIDMMKRENVQEGENAACMGLVEAISIKETLVVNLLRKCNPTSCLFNVSEAVIVGENENEAGDLYREAIARLSRLGPTRKEGV
jgi:hypothetical protein